MYTEFFKLCGFESEEIERERPRIEKAFEKAEIGPEDISRAESRIREFFDIDLVGVRKILGIWMKQLIDLALAREEGKKLVYTSFPTSGMVGLAANLASEEVYCLAPEIVLDLAMGQIFGKLDPILEAAEAHGMPPGIGMCSLNQARLGGIVKGIIPLPDVTLTSSFFCDQTAKTDDLLHEVYGVPNIFIDACMDSSWDEFPEVTPRRVEYFGGEMIRAVQECEKAINVSISEEAMRQAVRENAKLWFGMNQVWHFLKADPMPISRVDLGLFYWMITSPERIILQEGLNAINTLIGEVKQRVDEGKGVMEKGLPRVLMTIHQATDPSVMRMIEEVGLVVPVDCLGVISATEVRKSNYTTPHEKRADSELRRALYHGTSAMIHRHLELSRDWNVDGVLLCYPFSCRPFAIEPLMTKKAIEAELGIPVLALEVDLWDTRDYSTGALRTRVETFAEMLRATKAAKAG